MLQVGQVGVPTQGDGVDVDDAVFGRQEVEVHHLRGGPHTPVGLRQRRIQVIPLYRSQRVRIQPKHPE